MQKTIIIVLILMLHVSIGNTQVSENPKTSFALLAGVNNQTLNGKDGAGKALESSSLIGLHIGAIASIPIVPEFFFQPGLLFSTKGGKIKDNLVTGKYRISYIELPLNVVYKALLGKGNIMIGFGPYVAYGINGNATITSDINEFKSDIIFQNTIELTDPLTNTYFRPLDVGGNLFVGFELSGGIFVQLNTQYGMVNINPKDNRNQSSEATLKNIGFGLSLGYRFK